MEGRRRRFKTPHAWRPSFLVDVLQGFSAQKLDWRNRSKIAPGVTMIQTDDDYSLVNTYIAL